MPVEAICTRAREAGILSFIDGAHAPGMIPIDLGKIDADFYTGNCHKWMLSPKGAGFLYTRRDRQHMVEPLVVSWGWGGHPDLSVGNPYLDYFQWMGTDDPAAYLSVPAAIQFQKENDWDSVRQECYSLAKQAVFRICEWTSLPSIYPQEDDLCQQMVVVPLPLVDNLPELKTRLYNEFRVEIPCVQWGTYQFLRISIQAYNDSSDIDHLINALEVLLPLVASEDL
jgi:isopenicillin-N epimerase